MCRQFSFIGLLAICLFLLAACTGFGPVKSEPVKSYMLTTAPTFCAARGKTNKVISVAIPRALLPYDTLKMAYSKNPYEVSYFAKNRWADTLPHMLQPLIVQTLQNTHHYKAVLAGPSTAQYDLMLNTQLLELKQDFTQQPSQVHVALRAQILNLLKRVLDVE